MHATTSASTRSYPMNRPPDAPNEAPAADQTTPQAKEYNAIKNFLFIVNTLLAVGVFSFLAVTGLSVFLRAYLRLTIDNTIVLNGVFFLLLYAAMGLLSFPLEFYEGFVLERQFKLSKQTICNWLGDYLKKNAITFFLALAIVECVYFFLRWSPLRWWLYASLAWLAMTAFFTKIFPLFVLPLFFKSRPLAEGGLATRLHRLAAQFNFRLSRILILELSAKTIKANAMVAGLGRTKRIYLSDTLLEDFSPEEIEMIAAHELVHNRHHDIYKHLFVSFAASLCSFYFCDFFLGRAVNYFGYIAKDDIAAAPILSLLLIAAGIFLLPLQNSFSRRLERNADRGVIKATNNAAAFIAMIAKLGRRNLSELRPNKAVEFFLYDHPPIAERMRIAQEMRAGGAGKPR